jgi:hypothetical protein
MAHGVLDVAERDAGVERGRGEALEQAVRGDRVGGGMSAWRKPSTLGGVEDLASVVA